MSNKSHRVAAVITYTWTVAMILGAHNFKGTMKPSDFSTDVFVSAIAWLSMFVDNDKGTLLSMFAGVSMLVGPFWGWIVFKDFDSKDAGFAAIFGSGIVASWVVFGSYWVPAGIIGGVVAPIGLALYLVGYTLTQAKNAAVKAAGGETDDERRWRLEREMRAERDRQRRAG